MCGHLYSAHLLCEHDYVFFFNKSGPKDEMQNNTGNPQLMIIIWVRIFIAKRKAVVKRVRPKFITLFGMVAKRITAVKSGVSHSRLTGPIGPRDV